MEFDIGRMSMYTSLVNHAILFFVSTSHRYSLYTKFCGVYKKMLLLL